MTDDLRVRFLIVDDHQSIRKLCMTVGASLGFHCMEAENGEAALASLETNSPDIILADLMMPHMTGLEFLPRVKQILSRTEIAIMTGHGSIETAVQAMKLGAYDYITKPFRIEELKLLLQRMEEKVRLVAENQFLRDQVSTEMELNGIVGSSSKIQDVLRMVARLRDTRTPVLISGESGTGKELVAKALHQGSPRKDGPFVAINCAAMPENLLESELFGHTKGAFTDARTARPGLFIKASRGTLFLDEIGEMPAGMQAKLLRALQERTVRPVGGDQEQPFDARIIAATNRDLETEVEEKRFREDLFYRINVVRIHVPPLRARGGDILLLAQHFLQKYQPAGAQRVVGIKSAAADKLLSYPWPGNVRELQNCIERAVALSQFDHIGLDDLPERVRDFKPSRITVESSDPSELLSMDEVERRYILRVLDAVGGNKTLAAQVLGFDRRTLYRKLDRCREAAPAKRDAPPPTHSTGTSSF